MKTTYIKVENNDIHGSLKKFIGAMLENKFVEAVLIPKILPSGDGFVQSLVKDAAMLDGINPFAHTMPVQSAHILSDLSNGSFDGKIAAILKPCELKATIELAKFLQVNPDMFVMIGVDCAGTYEVDTYKQMVQEKKTIPLDAFLKTAAKGEIPSASGYAMRDCCGTCIDPVPMNPDMVIGFYGCDPSKELLVSVGSRFEKELAEILSLALEDSGPKDREAVVKKVKDAKGKARDGMLAEMKKETESMEKLLDTLSSCIRCRNCMNVCPICYCKECVFKSALFDHQADQLLNLAKRNGAVRLPGDTLIFHLTRMSHMATSCVSCGMCESACPSGIHVGRLFTSVGSEVRALFDYVPGRDIKEAPPVSSFKEDELENSALATPKTK